MKKIKTVKIPEVKAQPAKKREVVRTYCDFCNTVVPDHGSFGWYPSCCLCGRDCCRKHNIPDQDWSDHPDWYCKPCYNIKFVEFARLYEEVEEQHDKAVEDLDNKVKVESLSRGNS